MRMIIRALTVVAVLGVALFATAFAASTASADDPEQTAINVADVSQAGVAIGGDVDNFALVSQRNTNVNVGYGGAEQTAVNAASVRQFGLAVFGEVENTALVFQRNRNINIGW